MVLRFVKFLEERTVTNKEDTKHALLYGIKQKLLLYNLPVS
jgi:hypothetical protein